MKLRPAARRAEAANAASQAKRRRIRARRFHLHAYCMRPTPPHLGLTTVSDDEIALRRMLQTGSDTTFLREMIGFAAQRLTGLEQQNARLRSSV